MTALSVGGSPSGDTELLPVAPHRASEPADRVRAARFPCFDGLRGIAVLLVVVLHSAFYSGWTDRSGLGNYIGRLEIGVSLFFLISGFLLYRPFAVSHLSDNPAPKAGNFYVRRLLRIVPAYWVALTIIVYGLRAVSMGPGWQAVVSHYTFTQIYFPSQIFTGVVQAWSLCTEMSFYLFLPLYAAMIARGSRSPSRQLIRELSGVAVMIAISLAFRAWSLNQPAPCGSHCFTRPALVSTMNSWLPSYIDLFALGMLLAVASAWFTLQKREPSWLRHPLMPWLSWAAAVATFWGVSNLGIPQNPIYSVSPGLNIAKQTLYGVFAFFMLLPAVFGPQRQGAIRRALRWWPLMGIGMISYAIYLWHLAWITELVKWTGDQDFHVPYATMLWLVLAMSIATALVSYFAVERVALGLKVTRFSETGDGHRTYVSRTVSRMLGPVSRSWTSGRGVFRAWIERNEVGYEDTDSTDEQQSEPWRSDSSQSGVTAELGTTQVGGPPRR